MLRHSIRIVNAFAAPYHPNQNLYSIHERLLPGTDTEMVYRRATAIILSPPTPELPDSGDGVATVVDLERALAPLIGISTQRNADRVRHCLALLSSDHLLTIDPDSYWVGVPK